MFKKKSAKTVKRKICIKKANTFTIIALNFVQEQSITLINMKLTISKNLKLQVLLEPHFVCH